MLPSLINEFSRAIITQCPIIGQAFIHTVSPEPGLSWRITEDSAAPKWLQVCENPKSSCTISFDSADRIIILGQAGLLDAMSRPFTVNQRHIRLAADAYPLETVHPATRESFNETLHEFDDAMRLHMGKIGNGDIFGLLITPMLPEKGAKVLKDGKDYRRIGVCLINSQTVPRGGWSELTISLR